MAERDMTGDERREALGLPREPEVGDDVELATPGLARRRAGDPPRIGRLGFDQLDADLAGLAGGGGDLANLPPWSARDERAGGGGGAGERPDRDPVALAAWRRVAERRRLRASSTGPAAAAPAPSRPDTATAPDEPDKPDEPTPGEPAPDEPAPHEPANATGGGPAQGADRPGEPVAETRLDDDRHGLPADDVQAVEVPATDLPVEDATEDPAEDPAEDEPVVGPEPELAAGDGAGDEAGEVADVEPRPRSRGDDPGPSERPSRTPAPSGGHEARPRTTPRATTPATPPATPPARPEGGGRHEVLLSLAGRIDDDALSSVRELVAVEDDAAAAELLGGSLLAAGAGVTAREHAVLDRWFSASRVDPELIDALPRDPEADRREDHRFTADPPSSAAGAGGAGEVVARAAARLPGVQRVRQCWRTTPAGSAPGPVPHRVVLVETHSADDCEHVAHHVAHAARELGAVSVEVFAAGAELPAYHRAAVRAARPLPAGAEGSAWRGATTTSPAAGPGPDTTSPLLPRSAPPAGAEPGRPGRRGGDPVPPFGVPARPARAAGPAPTPAAGDAPTTTTPAADTPPRPERPDAIPDAAPDEGAEEQYRTVAAAGRDPLERADRVEPADPTGRIERVARAEPAEPVVSTERPVPALPPEAETVAPEEPAPVDLDADATAERIAALWRTPPPDEILSDEHPISAWAEGPVGVTFGPGPDEPAPAPPAAADGSGPGEAPAGPSFPGAGPVPGTSESVDPDAVTGDLPLLGAALPDGPPAGSEGRVRRSRHSRDETGGFEAPLEPAGPAPLPEAPRPAATNGHHHGPGGPEESPEVPTGPLRRPTNGTEAPEPGPSPARRPVSSSTSGPDSFDSQLSERERELLARLHEELASRERLEADAPDPLLGRPPQAPPGSEDTTAPRPRPTGPPPGPGRPPGPYPGPHRPAGSNGTGSNGTGVNGHHHGPVNGHGLPRRRDHDDEDGTSPDA